ncbi:MAG: hypothetical protein RBS49_07340 [Sphaerochaeta sp.]|jgi:hypothetical protein|nr:hypothetical protein [Sphaerochaeta sp.]
MRAEQSAILILLSFLLLFSSCNGDEPRYATLGESGQWERVLQVSSERFEQEHQVEDLYWMARARYERREINLAQRTINLYFALAYEAEITVEARRLAVLLPEGTHAIEQGRILEERDLMDSALAPSYYQALMTAGMQGEANRIFIHYLSDTLEARSYAQLLIRSHAQSEMIERALDALDEGEAIALLWEAAQLEQEKSDATLLAAVAARYESRSLSDADRLLLYAALSRFYTMADVRVLANKYRSLSQGL